MYAVDVLTEWFVPRGVAKDDEHERREGVLPFVLTLA